MTSLPNVNYVSRFSIEVGTNQLWQVMIGEVNQTSMYHVFLLKLASQMASDDKLI